MAALLDQINNAMKDAMRAKAKDRLGTIRLLTAAIKQYQVDNRVEEVADDIVLAILDKMVKQRRESIKAYTEAGREELAAIEQAEIEVLADFMPQPLTDDEIAALIKAAVAESGAENMRDMGKVMGILKPKLQGRADMGAVSGKIKARLS
ncbi:GatB/YqeY domain-containing protein [Pleionea litopenaei]|uniref:GatB/YqeY domain-containing protein n=1 Tax=Pleionea litopenaei TaxID=3070815 RepID=A0AA51RQ91_9GAMM|nr:GatB/YqeY domain-containing protein [Pleionea sp. HL-JVS1]WMS85590.1 GatB/YqeY domain-containing protein [Pleionea sp. HL-JVS1]